MAIKVRMKPKFPARVQGTNGIQVTKSNGVYTIAPNSGSLTVLASVSSGDMDNIFVGSYNSLTGAYARIGLDVLLTSVAAGLDATLISISAANPTTNQGLYFTAAETAATYSLTAGGRALSGLTAASDKLPYFNGVSTATTADLTAFGRSLIDDANAAAGLTTLGISAFAQTILDDAAAGNALTTLGVSAFAQTILDDAAATNVRTTLGLVIGTDVQAFHARLADIAGITYAQGDIFYHDGSNIVKLAKGTDGQFLKIGATIPAWATVAGGGDVLAANNGTEFTAATFRTNLGIAYGKQTIWIPAGAMTSRTTNGAVLSLIEKATNKNMLRTLDFDTTTQEFVQFEILMPKSWNESTVTFVPVWSHPSTTTNFGVAFGLAGVATSNDDASDVAFGTAVTSVDTGGTTDDIYMGPESAAITIAGTPAEGDRVQFQLNRTVADAGDTMAVDARLHGVHLFYTNNNTNDT